MPHNPHTMEHIRVKQESIGEDAMDIGSDFGGQDFANLDSVDSLQVELDLRKGISEPNTAMEIAHTSSYTIIPSSSSVQSNQIRLVSLSNNLQTGDQHVTVQNNQIVMTTVGSQPKNTPTNDSQKPMVTKLIIAKNSNVGQQQVLSVGPHGLQPVNTNSVNQKLIGQPSVVTTTLHNMASLSTNSSSQALVGQPSIATSLQLANSPTKTYTLSQSGILSPQKLIAPTTPTKYTVQSGKLAISPAKSPTKMMTVPMSSLHKSQKIVQMPGGQQYVMLTRPQTANPQSPSKVIIKGQGLSGVQTPQYAGSHAQSVVRQSTSAVSLSNISSNVQPVSVAGSKFQYVRLVTTPASHGQTAQVSLPPTIAPAPQHPLVPVSTTAAPIKLTVPMNSSQGIQMIQPKQTSQSQRLILPATSHITGTSIQSIAQTSNSALLSSNINSGQTINLQGLQGFALIPAQYMPQSQSAQPLQVKHNTYQPVRHNTAAPKNTSNVNVNGGLPTDSMTLRPRKPCNCTKSQCLKLYCDCFANGEFCSNCNCNNCFNNLDHEEERQRAIKTCLERNPHAFHPKIGKGKGRGGAGDRRHNKGCNCKRSGCLKNYCECYEAKIMCSNLCKCVGCKNFEESPDRKTLMHLADAAEVRHLQQTAVKTKLSSQIQELPSRVHMQTPGERLPYSFVTAEVAEATCACLVAQAEEAERTRQQEMMEERMILEEFGRCLMQVIQSSTRTKAPSPVP